MKPFEGDTSLPPAIQNIYCNLSSDGFHVFVRDEHNPGLQNLQPFQGLAFRREEISGWPPIKIDDLKKLLLSYRESEKDWDEELHHSETVTEQGWLERAKELNLSEESAKKVWNRCVKISYSEDDWKVMRVGEAAEL
jgi:hypothetical protein